MKVFVTTLFLVSFLAPIYVRAAESDDSPSAIADFAMAGLKDNCDQLRSGEYYARGRFESFLLDEITVEHEVEFHGQFDYDAQKVRVDRTQSANHVAREGSTSPEDEAITRKFCGTPEYNLLWNSRGIDMAVKRPEPAKTLSHLRQPVFDVRSMGFSDHANLSNTFEKKFALYASEAPKDAVVEPGEIYRLTWHREGAPLTGTMWIDTQEGFAPIRYEQKWLGSPIPRLETQMTWSQVAGVWVPKSFDFMQRMGTETRVAYHLTFDWVSVNEEIPDEVFTWQGFDLPRGARVTDLRLGLDNKIMIAHIGHEPVVTQQTPPPPLPER